MIFGREICCLEVEQPIYFDSKIYVAKEISRWILVGALMYL
jgi:hypothetical protein